MELPLDLTKWPFCSHLDASLNGMESISERAFHNITRLETLELGGNRFGNFPTRTFVPLVELRSFSAPRNRLPYIPVAVQGLKKVDIDVLLRLISFVNAIQKKQLQHHTFASSCFSATACLGQQISLAAVVPVG